MASPILLTIASVFKSAGLNQARTAVAGAGKDFGSLAGQIGKAAGSFAAFQALTSSREFIVQSVEQTQKFERNMLALQQVFESATPTLANFTKQVESYGLSQQQAAQASVFLGSVLKQYGFSVSESADQTKRLVTLAQDLATTYGYDVQDSLLAITALFRGEYDPIEKFGVAMKQNEINAYLAAQGLGDLEGAELSNAQATARLTLLFERAGDSVGAFTRASDTLYVAQQKLAAITGNLQVAFGAALQSPIAQVVNAMAELAQEKAPELVEVSEALGDGIEALQPLLVSGAELFLNMAVSVEPLVKILTTLTEVVDNLIGPVLTGLNDTLEFTIQFFDTWSAIIDSAGKSMGKLDAISRDSEFVKFLNNVTNVVGADVALGNFFGMLNNSMVRSEQNARAASGDYETVGDEARGASAALRGAASAFRHAAAKAAEGAPDLTYFQKELEAIGLYSKDAEGELSGLAGIFVEIADAAAKSEASEELELMGFNASQIEYFLTKPNWVEIFGQISRLAKLAAIDISKIMSVTAAAGIFNQQQEAQAILDELFAEAAKETKGTSKAADQATDYVKEFFDSLQDEVMKQTARLQLQKMTGSTGLIDQILGAEDWLSLWTKIKQGVVSLQELEDMFYKTAAGAQELADATEAWRKYDEAVQAVNDSLEETIAGIRKQAEALKVSFSDLLTAFDVLPTIAIEMGRFESAIVRQLASIESSLQSAFRNGDLFEEGYNELRKFARQELQLLQARQRQRDDMAERFSLSEGIISEYETAFTGALRLTNLFSQLKDETEKTTVTEVTKGVLTLGKSLRDFNIIVTREYEETITKVQDKTAGLLEGFKNMAVKARDFAANLRTLRDMGLDPQLFDQLVSAGVEAGGETAQALVDGGSETVNEISSIFAEINQLGADLGEEVATTLYGTGIDLVDGLIEGILSEQEKLETAAYEMAEAFNAAFQATLSSEVGKVTASRVAEETAKAADEIAKIPVPKLPEVNPALEQIEALIAGANKALSGQLSGVFREGVTGKLGAFEALKQDILSGQVTDLGGLSKGLTSADVEKIAVGTGGSNVQNYYQIDVNAGVVTDQQSLGETVVDAIAGFERTSGAVFVRAQ